MSKLAEFYRHYFFVLVPALLVIAYVYVTDPIIADNKWLQAQIQEKQALVSWMQESASRLPGGTGQGGMQSILNNPQALVEQIKTVASRYKLQANLKSITQAGKGAVQMRFDDVPVSRFFAMLDAILHGSSVEVASLQMSRGKNPGQAEVELTLATGKG